MGHTSTQMTFRIYGGWCREMGAEAAVMREVWAERAPCGRRGRQVACGAS